MTKLAIVGAGSVRCSPAVLASLATYFGERPLEIRLYDADEERLDLFDRYARLLFQMTKATHRLLYRPDLREALLEADAVLLQMGENCAKKMLKSEGRQAGLAPIEEALDLVGQLVPEDAEVLSLQLPSDHPDWPAIVKADWPPEPSETERRAWPHQILRWIKGEEHPYAWLAEHERSPIKSWLDDPSTRLPG